MLSLPREWAQSLARELRPHKPQGAAETKKYRKMRIKNVITSYINFSFEFLDSVSQISTTRLRKCTEMATKS